MIELRHIAFATRLLHGISMGTFFLASAASVSLQHPGIPQLIYAALLVGMACRLSLERWLCRMLSVRTLWYFSIWTSAAVITALRINSRPDVMLAAATMAGLAFFSEWSAMTEMVRNSVCARHRWKLQRQFLAAVPAGVVLSVLLWWSPVFAGCFVAVLMAGSTSMMLAKTSAEISVSDSGLPVLEQTSLHGHEVSQVSETFGSGGSESTPLTAAVSVRNSVPEAPASVTAEGECCGGSRSVFRSTRFGHGVALAAIGHVLIWICFADVMSLAIGSLKPGAMIGLLVPPLGLLAGQWLCFSSAPRTGYAVVSLPFLGLAAAGLAAIAFVRWGSILFWCLTFLTSAGLSAASMGLNTIAGELFTEYRNAPVRTRVQWMGLFSSAVVVIVGALVRHLPLSDWQLLPMECLIPVAGLMLIRSIPSPIRSSEGTEDTTADADDELRDVIAILRS